ncbi:DUF4251 domain-containing protein [Winogradskyella sp. R77965]|uniref:DUF4251 domain-containing protein n=1 Tax=Winogradskyella sp. R77965 TaxID=3093872 RepID=UPI0037DD581F
MIQNLFHRKLGLIFCIGMLGVLWNCKSNEIAAEKKYTSEISTLETFMEEGAYYVDVEEAFPFNSVATTQVLNSLLLQQTGNNAARIDVSGDGSFIEIQNDSVKGHLPFFGERRLSGGSYGGRGGSIRFEGISKDYEKAINKNKRKLEINFKTNQNEESTESYNVSLEIYPSERVNITIVSAFKTIMRYSGRLKPVNVESQ